MVWGDGDGDHEGGQERDGDGACRGDEVAESGGDCIGEGGDSEC